MADEIKPNVAPAPPAQKPSPAGPPAPPPPKNPGFVTGMIDGRVVVVKPGTSVIEAAKGAGVSIPYYCYHKRLTVAANCRMCLVEMSNAPMGKLMPACQMSMAEGVSVKTETPRVKEQQRATLEFLLLNHPVDCPICDQAGECKLQDYYMSFDQQPSRLDVPKLRKAKRVWLGPLVTLDQERCILCTRCVRFMREVAKDPQLGVAARGNESFIETFPGQPLDSKYSGNVVDLCPVGALTNTDFRFRGRVWFMSSSRSICGGCSRGCNVFLDHMNDTTYRIRPRENEAVNQEWMCDDGRLTYKGMNRGRALHVRQGKEARDTPSALAVSKAASVLGDAAKAKKLAVLVSPQASLEDQLLALEVARSLLDVGTVYEGGRAEGWKDDLLKRSDENPNRRGLELAAQAIGVEVQPFEELLAKAAAGAITTLWAVGTELPVEGALEKLSGLAIVAQAVSHDGLSEAAEVVLPAAPISEADGTFVNFEGRAQRFERAYPPRGQSRPHWAWAKEIALSLGQPLRFASAREVFLAFSGKLEKALGDFRWDSLPGRRPGSPSGFAGTVDGRLAGFREVEPDAALKDVPALSTGSEEGRP